MRPKNGQDTVPFAAAPGRQRTFPGPSRTLAGTNARPSEWDRLCEASMQRGLCFMCRRCSGRPKTSIERAAGRWREERAVGSVA